MTGPALVIFMHKRDNPHTHTHTHYFVLTADVEGKDCKTMQRPNIKKAADRIRDVNISDCEAKYCRHIR